MNKSLIHDTRTISYKNLVPNDQRWTMLCQTRHLKTKKKRVSEFHKHLCVTTHIEHKEVIFETGCWPQNLIFSVVIMDIFLQLMLFHVNEHREHFVVVCHFKAVEGIFGIQKTPKKKQVSFEFCGCVSTTNFISLSHRS